VYFSDGSFGHHDSIVWATGFNVSPPFLDEDVITWRNRVPIRYAGGILPEGAEKLYFVGLMAPRGPQMPIYAEQAKLVARMAALHEEAGPSGLEPTRIIWSAKESLTPVGDGRRRALSLLPRLRRRSPLSR